ncbi:MAG: phytoene/squalene synthase family protein [Pseudomonadota bacterium]
MTVILPQPSVGLPSDFDHCRRVIKDGSKSFHFASLLLPSNVRQAAYATYAFCRLADDEIDLGADPAAALERLSDRLDRIYDGKPLDHEIDRAFSHVVRVFALPRELPDALLEGMLWDTQNRRYTSIEDVLDYAARVAGSVGAMMTVLMGNRTPEAVARACDLGLAMQLTNIARDVGEDARAGRLYLPLDWLREVGIEPSAFLSAPSNTPEIRFVTKRLLDAAEPFYERGLSGVSLLPENCQTSIRAAGSIYREIGIELRRMEYNSVEHRAVVSKARKIRLLIGAAKQTSKPSSSESAAAATQYLVSAVTAKEQIETSPIPPTRINWLIDLFMRLERQERVI